MSAAPALSDYRSLTVIKPSSLGDVVHALPAVGVLRAAMPRAHLRWLVNPEWAPLLEGGGLVDEVALFPRREFRGWCGWPRAARWFCAWRRQERERPELVVDLQGLLRSGLAARLRGGDHVIGLSDAREGAAWLHDQSAPVDPDAHAVDRCLSLPRALGLGAPEEVAFNLPEGSRPKGWPAQDHAVIVVHPFSRGHGKSMPDAVLRRLLTELAPQRVVVVGSGTCPMLQASHVTDLCGQTTLLELVWCLRQARAVVSVDSGPMHIAAAVNPTNTLGLHTWSDPRRVGPHPAASWVWKAGRIGHRQDFTPEECRAYSPLTEALIPDVMGWVANRCAFST